MNDKKDPLPPPNATDAEVAKFWETHSLADYEQELEIREAVRAWTGSYTSPELLVAEEIRLLRQDLDALKSSFDDHLRVMHAYDGSSDPL